MYYVVNFLGKNDISAVPACWVRNDRCAWPPYRGKQMTKAIKDCEQPCPDWATFPCRIMGSSSTYEDAKRKEKKAEEMSDLATEDESLAKRRRKRPQHFLSSSDDEDTNWQAIESVNSAAPCSGFVSPPAPPRMPLAQVQLNTRPTPLPQEYAREPRRKHSSFQEQVLSQLKNMAAQLESHGKILKQMEMRQQGARTDTPNKLSVRPEIYQLFPLATHEDLLCLEDHLKDGENKEALILHFALLGGSTVVDVTRQVMRRCMLDSLAQNYCVTGRKGKKPMRDLGLLGVVIGAVRTCFKQKAQNGEPAITVQEADVKRAVAEWVRHAPARTKKMEQRASSQE
ncbi:uncharacterized protein LOC120850090 [Ixodes scapularis]|uniref:uncharacterized protein LOC120850090 n=1 Tax=Ixodes scapularis TaxID=6945 RepID=UPI001C3805AC|nr:uncharacterized protein LOC120850090 [Ixodes scapularis]